MKGRLAVGAIGGACMVYAVIALVLGTSSYVEVATYMIGLVVVHDVVFAALVALVGWLLARSLPPLPRAVVQGGLFVAVCAVVVAVPLLTGRGGAGNPTVNPLDYRQNVLRILLAVAVVTATLAVVRLRRR